MGRFVPKAWSFKLQSIFFCFEGFVSTEFIDHPGNIFRRNVQQVADGPRHKFDKVRSARPFQSRDLENVRQITSAIIERTPDLEMDLDESEQLYSTGKKKLKTSYLKTKWVQSSVVGMILFDKVFWSMNAPWTPLHVGRYDSSFLSTKGFVPITV